MTRGARARGWVVPTLTMVVGGAAGALAAVAVASRPDRSIAAAPSVASARPSVVYVNVGAPPAAPNQVDLARLAALEAAVKELQAASASPPTAIAAEPKDPNEERAEHLARHEADIATHLAAPRDPVWASKAAASLESALGAVKTAIPFAVRTVDCRTSTCIASLGWKSVEDARSGFQSVLHDAHQPGCTKRIMLPDAQPGPGEYRATLYVSCTSAS